MPVYSDAHKLALSGWLQVHDAVSYQIPLKLQKFLFFYEVFSKIDGASYNFHRLQGWKDGPVFSNVWGDYKNDRSEFDAASKKVYQNDPSSIDHERAEKTSYLIRTLNVDELSELTHRFDIWKSQSDKIIAGTQYVNLYDQDFSEADRDFAAFIESLYSLDQIRNSVIRSFGKKNFVLSKEDFNRLTDQQVNTLRVLGNDDSLHNPVFVEIDQSGALCID